MLAVDFLTGELPLELLKLSPEALTLLNLFFLTESPQIYPRSSFPCVSKTIGIPWNTSRFIEG